VSDQIRQSRASVATGIALGAATLTGPAAAPEGLTVPPGGTAGRLIYDDMNQWNFDVKLVRGEGDPAVAGENANHAYDDLGLVRDYYKQKLGRNSIDNAGMVFGNGDGVIFKDFTGDIDVPGHELTHGVTQYTAGLNYTPDQTGALNESFSDMMGSAIDAWSNNRDADAHNWLIGEDIMADDLYGEALRNMAEPGTAYDDPILGRDPQPRDMTGYFQPADPHIMSGITNRWYYLICKEIGMDAGTLIMYQTLQNLWPTAVFNDAAVVAAAQARILAENKQVPPEAAQVVRSAARQQGFW
jgi:Zn-dependent metalloprotease